MSDFERGFRAGYAACIKQVREGKIPAVRDGCNYMEDAVALGIILDKSEGHDGHEDA